MAETRLPLETPPGLYRNGTRYQARGRWYDGNGVRFISGTIQPVGGWRAMSDDLGGALAQLAGTPRAAVAWRSDGGVAHIAVGTVNPSKLYLLVGGTITDITPDDLPAGHTDTDDAPAADPDAPGVAYGVGLYGAGLYGGGTSYGSRDVADTWQLDVYEGALVAVPSVTGLLYRWGGDLTEKAALVVDAPPHNSGVVATPEHFLFLLGAGGNTRAVQWPSQEDYTGWEPTAESTAGAYEIASLGAFVAGRRTRKETLLWTDTDLHSATYIGGSFLYRFEQQGEGCGLVAPNAAATFDTNAIWMSRDGFFTYDGFVKPLACDVRDEVFGNINRAQLQKVWALPLAEFGEVWWFYPSGTSVECDRYVAYSYRENHWSLGTLARTAGVDANAAVRPVLLAADGTVYEHETGQDRAGMTPYLESGPLSLGAGDQVLRVQKLYPDERTRGDVVASVYTAMALDGAETPNGPFPLADETDVRLTARFVRLRLDEAREADWRVGIMHLGVLPGGRR